jgi:hypothetical protein
LPLKLSPLSIRSFKEEYENLKAVQEKCCKLLSALEKSGKATPIARHALASARSMAELDHSFAPFKTGSKVLVVTKLPSCTKILGIVKSAIYFAKSIF